MSAQAARTIRQGVLALAATALLLGALSVTRAGALTLTECQHPVVTGVEVYNLHRISTRAACPVALALYRWENQDDHAGKLYGCRGFRPYLRLRSFQGWKLKLTPSFVMSRNGASFGVSGTDFPVDCS